MDCRSFQRAAKICLLAGLLGLAVCSFAAALEPKQPGGSYLEQKEFFKPELYISSSQVPVEEIAASLPNRGAWEQLLASRAKAGQAAPAGFIDPRSGAATNLLG